jgi:hypothetical protein
LSTNKIKIGIVDLFGMIRTQRETEGTKTMAKAAAKKAAVKKAPAKKAAAVKKPAAKKAKK